MKLVHLLPIGNVDPGLLADLRDAIPDYLHVSCVVHAEVLDPRASYHPERQQYHSSEILQHMRNCLTPRTWRLLGVTDVDLYIPILKYVFGEAQVGGPCAVISSHRLRQELYGLEPDEDLLRERLLKEAVHELGHTFDLRHCDDYRCAMASSHAVEWIDLRDSTFCDSCREKLAWTL